ncbi:MAG TPA: fasciclin domain-containing protein [Rhodothermales bacterium]|nr:fasciclin domain-containing protein [Rhodothermales bacterium]
MTSTLRTSRLLRLALLASTLYLAACRQDVEPAEAPADTTDFAPAMTNTIVDVAMADDQFTTLVDLLRTTGLDSTLRGSGPFTLFAPTNEAFSRLPAGTLDTLRLAKNRPQLVDLLRYHVTSADVKAADFAAVGTIATLLSGATLTVSTGDAAPSVTDAQGGIATILSADAAADNGTIHVVDAVLRPPQAQAAPSGAAATPPPQQ